MKFQNSEYQKNQNAMRKWETLEGWPEVKGYDFSQGLDFNRFIESLKHTGLQATQLGKAIDIVNEMIAEKTFIFLSATSNMGSSGVRDIIRWLVQEKKIHCLVMSAGAVEEDVIKTLQPFVIGSYDAPGSVLLEKGVGRIGNIFAPFDRYLHFEDYMRPFFEEVYVKQKEQGRPFTPSEFIKMLGEKVESEESILHWAAKNDIPVFCPALVDGSIGDLWYFHRQQKKDFMLDLIGDHEKIIKLVLTQEKTGVILLGGGVSKHYVLNANIFKDGLDYAVYLTTAQEFDGSDSGGNQQEAMSWAKVNTQAKNVKVVSDATLTFPLLVAGSFAKQ
ncbi:MAG: deoxyhypusine synthase [Candidatus Woesearchaeota archaeon]